MAAVFYDYVPRTSLGHTILININGVWDRLLVPLQAMLSHVLLGSLLALATAAPQVKLGDTTLVGRDVTLLNQDFFGGNPPSPVASLTTDMLYSDPLCRTSSWRLTSATSSFEGESRK